MTERVGAKVPTLNLDKAVEAESKEDEQSYAQTDRRTQRQEERRDLAQRFSKISSQLKNMMVVRPFESDELFLRKSTKASAFGSSSKQNSMAKTNQKDPSV